MPTWDLDESRLRAAASQLRLQLDLDAELARIGEATLTGSAALKVMVDRDVDLTVVVPRLDGITAERVAGLARRLSMRPDVREVVFRNDTGRWNTDPGYPDGLYLRVTCAGPDAATWTIDLWFVDEPDRQPDLEHLRSIAPRITPQTQATILGIKRAGPWRRADGSRAPSYDIYRAVLDSGVVTPDDYRRHRSARG